MTILIAIDGSPASLEAARYGLRLARDGLRTGFVLATVQEPTYLYEMVLAPNAEALERISGAVGRRVLAPAEALFEAAGVSYEREIGSGDPATALLEIAQRHGCTAILMGARGMGALRGMLLGSVSQAVIQRATVPVTVVRPEAEEAR
ncbi:MAG: universal stress protein [Burkholderiales bacterium]|nr:MAG: universal stress protein [Burkholderiales bacterium]